MMGVVSNGHHVQQTTSRKEDANDTMTAIPTATKQSGLQPVPGSGGKDQSMATSPSGGQGEAVMYYLASGYSPPYYYNYSSAGYVGSPPAMTADQWEYMRASGMGGSDPQQQQQATYAANGNQMYVHSPPAFPSHMYSPQPYSFQPQAYSAATSAAGPYISPTSGPESVGGGDGPMMGQADGGPAPRQPLGPMGGADGAGGKGGGGRGGYWQSGDPRMQQRTMNPKGTQSGYRPANGFTEYGQGRGGNGYSNGYHNNGYHNNGYHNNGYQSNGYHSNGGGGRGWRGGFEKGGRGRGRNNILTQPVHLYNVATEQNRGPRTSRSKGAKAASAVLPGGVDPAKEFNLEGFPTTYETAKFFVIKSYSEDDIHKCIKYRAWASTANGNRKLSAAYNEAQGVTAACNEAQEVTGSTAENGTQSCPIFLFFSVNASGQFCGVAEMAGPLDATQSCQYWQQDKWTGQFAVRWHLIKDVPNGIFGEIRLANNENKPVTNSRDTQEISLKQGMEMLTIFKSYEEKTSILDDFYYYDDREAKMQERRLRQNGVKAQPQQNEGSETQNGCAHPQSEKDVGEERVDSVKEEVDRGQVIISPEVPEGGSEAADEREGKEEKQTDSMTNTMGTLSLS